MGMGALLQTQIEVSDEDMRHQLEYIVQQLESDTARKSVAFFELLFFEKRGVGGKDGR